MSKTVHVECNRIVGIELPVEDFVVQEGEEFSYSPQTNIAAFYDQTYVGYITYGSFDINYSASIVIPYDELDDGQRICCIYGDTHLLPSNDYYLVYIIHQSLEGNILKSTLFYTFGINDRSNVFEGYEYAGLRIDGGALQYKEYFAEKPLDSHHKFVFLYRKIDGEQDNQTIVEQYRGTEGEVLRSDAYEEIVLGGAYQKNAITIAGYKCIGHRIDGGDLIPSTTATIPDVQADHTVTFVYEPDENGGEEPGPDPTPGGSGKCACCGSLELRLKLPVCNNSEMLEPLTRLVQAAKSGDCSCGEEE